MGVDRTTSRRSDSLSNTGSGSSFAPGFTKRPSRHWRLAPLQLRQDSSADWRQRITCRQRVGPARTREAAADVGEEVGDGTGSVLS